MGSSNPIQYCTLVSGGGTPIRIADQFGAPYPTTGHGKLVFSDQPVLYRPTLIDPILEGDSVSFTAVVFVSDHAPSSPIANQLWWNSRLGQLFVYYNDGNTTQWVPASPGGEGGGGTAGAAVAIGDTPPASPADSMLWWNSVKGQLFVWYDDGNTSQWVEASPGAGASAGVFVGDAPPTPPVPNTLWWDSTRGELFLYYFDGNTSQWVPASPNSAGSSNFSVKDFGAAGDGVTDDTGAIQAAIDSVYAAGGGVVNFPKGTYKVSASTLNETYSNSYYTQADQDIDPTHIKGTPVPVASSGSCIIQRSGVSLIGQPDRSAKIYSPNASLTIISQIAPANCVVEGFEIYSIWTAAVPGPTGIAIITLATGDGTDRKCRNNLYRNLYVHNVGGYGVSLQNGLPTRCRIEDVDIYDIGCDGLDLKARDETTHEPVGNSVTNCTIRKHGQRGGTSNGSAGMDVRGIWHISGVAVTDFGTGNSTDYNGVRFRTMPDVTPPEPITTDWPHAGKYSTLTGFYIKADPAATGTNLHGVYSGSKNVQISNGVVIGCHFNYTLGGNANGSATECVLTNITSIDARTYGCWITSGGQRARIIGYTSMGSVVAGFRNEATAVSVFGHRSISDAADVDLSTPGPIPGQGPPVALQVLVDNTAGQAQFGGAVGVLGPALNVDRTGLASPGEIHISTDKQQTAGFNLRTGAINRWTIRKGTVDETGSNVGSDFEIVARADDGATIGAALFITRATANVTFAATVITAASHATRSGLRLPHGAVPTTPVNGDIWTTSAGMFVRINGVTKTVTLT